MDLSGGMEGELGYVYGDEEQEEQDEEDEEDEEEPARGRKKKKVVCLDPTTGANQSLETYWARIKAEFDKRKLVDPYFKDD